MHLDHNLDHGQQTFPAKVQTVIILGFFTLAVIQVCLCTTAGFSYDIEWEAVLDNSQQMGMADSNKTIFTKTSRLWFGL